MRTVLPSVLLLATLANASIIELEMHLMSFGNLMQDAPHELETAKAKLWSWLHIARYHQTPKEGRPGDGYLDTLPDAERLLPPGGDPIGDNLGWGDNAEDRETTQSGNINFSLLDALLGRATSCKPWSTHCTVGIFVSIMLMMWTFKNLKVISDVYFVPSTIRLAKKLGMSNDVAGATLLAFGSSAPEFCTNVVASLFITNECGVGDIVGSAIHNILLIVGMAGIFAHKELSLWWYPLSRDSLFFFVAVCELLGFLWDEHLQIWEASVMCLTYGVYCAWMYWNTPIYENICSLLKIPADKPDDEDGEDDEGEGVLYYDPIEILWRNTMPDSKEKALSCFLFALLQIAWNAYLMVDAATRFGTIMGIPPLFMGLVFLAAGTSIPDAFASIAAARKGEADMAVSNALGSNIFDILVGLGLPWLVALVMGKPIVFLGVNRLLYWVVGLIVVLAAFMAVVVAGNWKLSYRVGVSLTVLYVCYVFWALVKAVILV